jgi:hypothetical protein
MITKGKGKVPISGGRPQFRPTPNVLSDAAATSRDGQKLVRASPSPMQNRQGPMNISAPVHPYFDSNNRNSVYFDKGSAPNPLKKAGGFTVSRPAAGTTAQMLAAVGEPRLPKGYNSIQSGYATRGATRTVGGGNQPSANQRAKYPGIFGSTKYRP